MQLKTATLIAIIGISINFVLGILWRYVFPLVFDFSFFMRQAYGMLSSILFYGSIVLFLAVFYSKQKDST
jgi:hypothetical protein